MTTGFMKQIKKSGAASLAALYATLFLSLGAAHAADVTVTGLFNGKAVLVINGSRPRTMNVGETVDGVKLVSANSETAVVEVAGKRQTLGMGHATRLGGSTAGSGVGDVTLRADTRGHFFANGSINGASVRFLVDTGASSIALSVDEARRLGVNYLAGVPGRVSTANGTAAAYRVKFDTVRIGDITLNNVDGVVVDGMGLNVALLGMSFLNRTQMKRDGDTLVLTRRY
jgi:aspartyl protease family protein